MDGLKENFARIWELDPNLTSKLIASAIVVVILVIIHLVIIRVLNRKIEDIRVRYNWRKTTTYVLVLVGMLITGRIWYSGFQPLLTYLGLLSAGIAIALRDPLVNLAAWLFIVWRRPFTVGDRIEVGTYKGDVVDLRIFQFTLMEIGNWVDGDQSTGRVIRIPNGKVFTEMLANYSKGFRYIWDEVPVLVTFESNWKRAKEILTEIGKKHAEHLTETAANKVREASSRMMIFYKTLTPTVYTSVRDYGVLLTIRYLCKPRERRGAQHAIWEDILNKFAECNDIDFAYPTMRRYNNTQEGKPGARASLPGLTPGQPQIPDED
ncbi:MAG: mechanosensitive ion channel family protein [candidate division Zixibacteria bacterium]|nr:mechanosensitive ion channel family protein [candidate division Zixibacteria bacterium]MBU1470128.1 mechanosensitive ion channel family protein [candidate division Zixibacteria bacterium]MBU2626485.1 mechanosensitive ion channel family protein [candidate division Zixibacteria bacterium]